MGGDTEATYIVTGANTGIGKATAAGLARRGARVMMVSRDPAKGEAAKADLLASQPGARLEVVQGDLGSLATTRALAEALLGRCPRIDALVNNAGVWMTEREETPDGFEKTFGVNHLAPFLLTHLLRDRLAETGGARIVNLSSALYVRGRLDFDDLQSERGKFSGTRAYSTSKLANLYFTQELARRLEGSGVTTYAVHPGVVRTELPRRMNGVMRAGFKVISLFLKSPAQGAATSLHCATAPGIEAQSGRYFAGSRPRAVRGPGKDVAAARRLWEVSERLVGLAR